MKSKCPLSNFRNILWDGIVTLVQDPKLYIKIVSGRLYALKDPTLSYLCPKLLQEKSFLRSRQQISSPKPHSLEIFFYVEQLEGWASQMLCATLPSPGICRRILRKFLPKRSLGRREHNPGLLLMYLYVYCILWYQVTEVQCTRTLT
jgi:hypothetical protein